MTALKHILDESTDALGPWLTERGEPAFRARQIRHWLFAGRAEHFDQMTDIPLALRHDLSAAFTIWTGEVRTHRQAEDGTEKLVLQFPAQSTVECVLLRDQGRRTICVSSQVGCAMGCVFCASGLNGVERNLSSSEILEQALRLQHLLPREERLSHVVVMGMGEPLANLDSVLAALRRISAADGLGISPRRITISTVGLPAALDRLTERRIPYQLAISLHAPNDALRNRLVPVNDRIGIQAILSAADRYMEMTGQRITIEYVLMARLNDSEAEAQELGRLLRGRNVLLNVIPYNRVTDLPYQTPGPERIRQFCHELRRWGVNVQIRERKGNAIDAACGQLRRETTAPSTAAHLPSAELYTAERVKIVT